MVQQTIIAVVMGVVLCTTTLIASEQCNDGYINQHLCQKTCNFTHCSCIMTETTPFTSCTQTCNFLSSCPQMVCSGRNACSQKCFFGSCNMKCGSSKFCSQSCVWKAKCRQITCSSPICNQVCANCSMECSRGVERCEQMCLGGECQMKCFAQNCKRQCFKGKCNYTGHSQSKAPIIQRKLWIVITVVSIHQTSTR